MHHVDWQQIIALGIVAAAAAAVARRLGAQVVAFRTPRRRGGARPADVRPSPTVPTTLIQIQTKPPAHLKRPPSDGS